MTTKLDPQNTEQSVEKMTLTEGNEEINPEMAKKDPEPEPPKITNSEGDKDETPKRTQVNKKLSAMSKNTMEKQKNRRLSKPTSSIP